MANFQNRTRVVYVRVSEHEFQQFRDLCHQQGARNMSDLVRSAMGMMVQKRQNDFESEVTQRLQQLESSLNDLNRVVAQMASEKMA